MSEQQNTEMTQEEMMEALMKQLQQSIDPRDYLTPTQREIAFMSLDELQTEYEMVQQKQSTRGRMQRDLIVSRFEYEQNKETQDEQSNNIL